jgi:hypothetical protein
MEYGRIIAVTGLPGLYELLSSKSDGAIVRSLEDKSTKFVSSRVHNFSHLESIEVFTVRENVNLSEIFKAMESNAGKVPEGKDAAELKKYFEKVYPDLDFERVYSSDLKKMAKWFGVLKANDVEIKVRTEEEVLAEQGGEEAAAHVEEKPKAEKKAKEPVAEAETEEETKPKKTAVKKKAAPKKAAEETSEENSAEKPVKKAARKKKSEE